MYGRNIGRGTLLTKEDTTMRSFGLGILVGAAGAAIFGDGLWWITYALGGILLALFSLSPVRRLFKKPQN